MLKHDMIERIQARFADEGKCSHVLNMFSLFSNPVRFRILCTLSEGDFSVQEIVEITGGKISNVSQQLKMLTLAGYLSKERQGKHVFYHLVDEKVRSTIAFMHQLFEHQN